MKNKQMNNVTKHPLLWRGLGRLFLILLWRGLGRLFLIILYSLPASAQNDTKMREVYVQAESDYQIGRIEQARNALLQNLGGFQGNLRQNALRLISLSYLARFDTQQAEQYAALMLQQNPYYSPSSADPAAFADIVNDIKAGMTATITTASSQAETLAEVPVPTTLITAEMIQNSGARNLQEVLAAYVPGMNIIDCNDDINIAMRGIYSNTQEKILFMLNGHRLNSYATNTAAPDFSISLEKIKQIEVLRGPASSLYGGVALTAVVNIITLQGADVDGLQAKASVGNYHQFKADAVLGKHYFDVDLLIWGSLYRNSGECYDVTSERVGESQYAMPVDNIRIGRIGNRPNYDFGLQLGYKGLQFMYDTHFSQVVSPFTMTSLALSYDYDRYRTYNGLKPGFSVYSRHADLNYQWSMFNIQWKAAATYDKSDLTRYQVINDYPMPSLGMAIGLPDDVTEVFAQNGGISRYVNGQEQDYGLQLKGNHPYIVGDHHKGNIGFGAEYGHFQLDDIRYQIGYDFEQTFFEDPLMRNAGKGSENSINAYLQLKHQWDVSLFSLIANAGVRYDIKTRYDDTKIHELSPRLALILLRPKWDVKFSYSKSFVDAPYIYRKANVLSALMAGGENTLPALSPERVHSFQLSFAGNNWAKGLNFEVNGFYNYATDLIMTSIIDYMNASKNKTCGLELMANYRVPSRLSNSSLSNSSLFTLHSSLPPLFTLHSSLTFIRTLKSNLIDFDLPDEVAAVYTTDIDDSNNTPDITANLVLAWQPIPQLKLHTHLLFESQQTSYNTDLVELIHTIGSLTTARQYAAEGKMQEAATAKEAAVGAARNIIMHKDMPARAILNLGGEYSFSRLPLCRDCKIPITLGLNIHNLLGTRYYRSGMNTNVIPQQGRWFLATIGISL